MLFVLVLLNNMDIDLLLLSFLSKLRFIYFRTLLLNLFLFYFIFRVGFPMMIGSIIVVTGYLMVCHVLFEWH